MSALPPARCAWCGGAHAAAVCEIRIRHVYDTRSMSPVARAQADTREVKAIEQIRRWLRGER